MMSAALMRLALRGADRIGAAAEPLREPVSPLHRRITSREAIANILLTNASAATLTLTYFGAADLLAEGGGSIIQKGQALIFAIVIAILSWLGWYYLFGLVDRLKGRWLALAGAAGMVFVAVIVAIDAPFNMQSLAGASAVQHSLVDVSAAYEPAVQKVFARNAGIRQMVPGIEVQAARFSKLEQQEQRGAQSGKVGSGKISAAFGQVSTLLGELAKLLNTNFSQADALQREAAGLLAELKTQVYKQAPTRDRSAESAKIADRLDAVLGRLAQLDGSVSVKATLDAMDSLFPAAGRGGNAFETLQNAEVARIGEMAKPVAAALRNGLPAANIAKDAEALPHARPLDSLVAIFRYWRSLVPQWTAAIFVDVAPAILLIILIASRREAERQDKHKKGDA